MVISVAFGRGGASSVRFGLRSIRTSNETLRYFRSTNGSYYRSFSTERKLVSPPIVYIKGEEMTRYCMDLILKQWIEPNVDISSWQFYDLSCKSRDDTEDQVLHDAIAAGKSLGSIFKEPTVTPTAEQKEKLGLKKAWGSPNGAMRRGWKGITISRDTIHIEGMDFGFKNPVLFERHAVGGEYSAGYGMVGAGKLKTIFFPKDQTQDDVVIDERFLEDDVNAVVTYHNPLDNVTDLAHHFFQRCLKANVTPYVVTKKTVFKWQEEFWTKMLTVFEEHYKEGFLKAGLLNQTGGNLMHLISDAATMQIIRWTDGGFGMAAHNYDGDMLTDEIAQVHRSPGFITSNLIGKNDDGSLIKEFEASHGTVTDMWEDTQNGIETSLNPLGLVEALIGAIEHSVHLQSATEEEAERHEMIEFTRRLRRIIHRAMVEGKGTRDISGPKGLTTEQFVNYVGKIIQKTSPEMKEQQKIVTKRAKPVREKSVQAMIDEEAMRKFFTSLDTDGNGVIDYDEFCNGMINIGMYPKKFFQDPGEKGNRELEDKL
uniref:EF-hand domain-containing protein n=1 Tax=Aplanochytrium stocchinoi TaxID=215587 RepID=A0A7S3PF85_9STRA